MEQVSRVRERKLSCEKLQGAKESLASLRRGRDYRSCALNPNRDPPLRPSYVVTSRLRYLPAADFIREREFYCGGNRDIVDPRIASSYRAVGRFARFHVHLAQGFSRNFPRYERRLPLNGIVIGEQRVDGATDPVLYLALPVNQARSSFICVCTCPAHCQSMMTHFRTAATLQLASWISFFFFCFFFYRSTVESIVADAGGRARAHKFFTGI